MLLTLVFDIWSTYILVKIRIKFNTVEVRLGK